MTPVQAIGWAILGPLVAIVLTRLFDRRPNVREVATLLVGSGVFAIVAGVLTPAVMGGERPRLELFDVVPGVTLAFEVEPLGVLFGLVASGLWVVTTLFAIGYMRGHKESNQTRFYMCFAAAIFGSLGVAFAANVFTLFVFYELITLSTYPLVTHHGTEKAKKAGRTYLGVLMGTSIAFLLLALVWTHQLAGGTDFRPGGILAGKADADLLMILLALYAFGAGKAALMPFHRWLPAAMVAPTPVSALLHAVAVVKAGVFTILKVVIYIFGLDLLQDTGASQWLTWVAAATLLSASIVAIRQDNLKRRLAYSTISQLAYIVLCAALATPSAVLGGALNIAMHAMGKITLFFCAGAIYVEARKTNVSDMRGLGRRMPFTLVAFLIGSASVIGLPPFGGGLSKIFLTMGAAEAQDQVMVWVYMLSSLLAIGYLMPVVFHGFYGITVVEEENRVEKDRPLKDVVNDLKRAPFLVGPPVLTALGCVGLAFGFNFLCRLLEGMGQ